MRIAVFGVGGVGGYFGGRLAQAGEDVVFLARGEHLRALCAHGLRVESIKGDFTVSPVQATDDPTRVGVVDVVLVGVKAWQVPDVALAMRPLIGAATTVVPLQNGLEAPAQLAAVLGAEHVLGGTCAIYSFIASPGCIRHIGLEPTVTVGTLDTHASTGAERLRQALQQAGVTASIAADIRIPMWEKFLILRWGIIGAVTRAPAGIIRQLPDLRQMVVQACDEVMAVARAHQVMLAEDVLPRSMALLDSLPAAATTSLQRDVIDGRPSEIDAQAGALLRLGRQVGSATPLHTFLYQSVLPMEMRARGQLQFPE